MDNIIWGVAAALGIVVVPPRDQSHVGGCPMQSAPRASARKLPRAIRMTSLTLCAAGVFAPMINLPAAAQQSPDVATDQELFAGYCFGVAVQSKAHSLQTGNASLDASIARLNDDFINHFRDYLTERGLFSSARSNLANGGILEARKHGERDDIICEDSSAVCIGKCHVQGLKLDLNCLKECNKREYSCVSIQRCYNSL
jgi:hypothetical protein